MELDSKIERSVKNQSNLLNVAVKNPKNVAERPLLAVLYKTRIKNVHRGNKIQNKRYGERQIRSGHLKLNQSTSLSINEYLQLLESESYTIKSNR